MGRIDLDYSQLLVQIGYAWIDISADNRGETVCEWGLLSNAPLDRVGQTGRMSFQLINTTRKYTPDSDTALVGWGKGCQVKLILTYWGDDYVRFKGVIDDIDIHLGVGGHQYVTVTCLDWMEYAAKTPIINPGILEDKRGDEALSEVVDLSPIPPDNTAFDVGVETFPTVFDTVDYKTKAYSEFVKIALSEVGFIYLIKDSTYGETLVFESAHHRTGLDTLTPMPASLLLQDDGFALLQGGGRRLINTEQSGLTIDNTMLNTAAIYGEQILNRLTAVASPRRLDASPQILFQLDKAIAISSGQTLEISGSYADPSGGNPINGQDMIAPVATTDYLMNRKADGTGTNLTASMTIVSAPYGSDGFIHTVRNDSAYTGYITKYNARGTGIYIYNPVEHVESADESIAIYGYQTAKIDQKYQNDFGHGGREAAQIVEFYKTPRTLVYEIELCANVSDEIMVAFLNSDIGDLVRIVDDQLDIDNCFHIHGVRFSLGIGGLIMYKWIVKIFHTLTLGLSLLAVEFGGIGTKDGINFGHLPYVYSNDSPTTISISAWIYTNSSDWGTVVSFPTDNGGFRFYVVNNRLWLYANIWDVSPGSWWPTVANVTTGAWHHVIVTYDFDNTANDPVFYVNGTQMVTYEDTAPAGSEFDRAGVTLMIGNWKTATQDYPNPLDGKIADVRIYHHELSQAEVTSLYAAGRGGTYNPDDLVFWGLCARTPELPDYIDENLENEMKLLDNIYGAVGMPIGSPPPIGRELT